MTLSETHDFYLGRGSDAEWLGSARLDRPCDSALRELSLARTADEYAGLVEQFLEVVDMDLAGHAPAVCDPWPWLWPTSHGTDWTYAFDDGAVWLAQLGRRWAQRADQYVPPHPGEGPVVFPHMRPTCGYTGIDAADTVARRYGPRFGDTHDFDIHQLAVRILADLTLPARVILPGQEYNGETGDDEEPPFAGLAPHLRYAVTSTESAVEIAIEVFGYREGDPAAQATEAALSALPAYYGWSDPGGGPPRFGVRVRIADDARHAADPILGDRHTCAALIIRN